jgi:hypothetical protein
MMARWTPYICGRTARNWTDIFPDRVDTKRSILRHPGFHGLQRFLSVLQTDRLRVGGRIPIERKLKLATSTEPSGQIFSLQPSPLAHAW